MNTTHMCKHHLTMAVLITSNDREITQLKDRRPAVVPCQAQPFAPAPQKRCCGDGLWSLGKKMDFWGVEISYTPMDLLKVLKKVN